MYIKSIRYIYTGLRGAKFAYLINFSGNFPCPEFVETVEQVEKGHGFPKRHSRNPKGMAQNPRIFWALTTILTDKTPTSPHVVPQGGIADTESKHPKTLGRYSNNN